MPVHNTHVLERSLCTSWQGFLSRRGLKLLSCQNLNPSWQCIDGETTSHVHCQGSKVMRSLHKNECLGTA